MRGTVRNGPAVVGVALVGVALLLAGSTNDAWADVTPALDAIERGDCAEAGALINEGLARNDAQAYFLAGYLYASTGCVDEDLPRAARLYQRSIELGSDDGRRALGLMYGLGLGVQQDYRVAYRWFTYPIGEETAKPALDGPREIATGYAYTVQRLAQNRVVYPSGFDQRKQGVLYVQFHTPTGAVTCSTRSSSGVRAGEPLDSTSFFCAAVEHAYAEAVAAAPRPVGMTDVDVVYEAPWTFRLR